MPLIARRLPLALKVIVTGFLVVMVPVYYRSYGPTNFLYFCDVALGLAAVSLWTERPLPASMAAVGILLPQALWCLDFLGELVGVKLVGLTAYMFDPGRSLFLRGLSFFHFWLPFLLLYIVRRLGYDRRALWGWTALGWGLCLVSYFLLPPAGTVLDNPQIPVNINYVGGFDDAKMQTLAPGPLYLAGWLAVLFGVIYLPTHLLLRKLFKAPAPAEQEGVGMGAPAARLA